MLFPSKFLASVDLLGPLQPSPIAAACLFNWEQLARAPCSPRSAGCPRLAQSRHHL